jgi:hypothetical protein
MNSRLYEAADSLMAHIGHNGSIDARHPAVTAVMDALASIDEALEAPATQEPGAVYVFFSSDGERIRLWTKDVRRATEYAENSGLDMATLVKYRAAAQTGLSDREGN